MRKWMLALLATCLACIPILLHHATSPNLLQDSDTRVLLATIRQKNAPFSWFAGDWPLYNHFYRPVSTLAFEFDNRVYGRNAAGYGWTNDLLCVACVLLLFWFVRELTNRPLFAAACSILFALWHYDGTLIFQSPLYYLAVIVFLVGLFRHRRHWALYVPASLALLYMNLELMGRAELEGRMIGWLPGRTASVMTVFTLISLAAYARYERTSAARALAPSPSPLDPPATRNTVVEADTSRMAWVWLIVSFLGLALALASYEQAVMLPAALLGVAVTFRLTRYQPRWLWHIGFWCLLGGYLVLRHRLLPSGESSYQMQQLRTGPGVRLSLSDYILPVAGAVPGFMTSLDQGVYLVFSESFYGFWLYVADTAAAVWILKKHWILGLTGWALSIIAYLPMAWVKQFEHYHYWPMAMRSVMVVALGWACWDACATALRPREMQAPARLVPAPGSLPHP